MLYVDSLCTHQKRSFETQSANIFIYRTISSKRDFEEASRGLFQFNLSRQFSGETEEHHDKPQSYHLIADLFLLYYFFWVIPRHLNFMCRCFGTLCLFHLYRSWRWYRMSVPKRRHIKFRRRGITQKKEYNIHNFIRVFFIFTLRNVFVCGF
jgi:hypothetical protein